VQSDLMSSKHTNSCVQMGIFFFF